MFIAICGLDGSGKSSLLASMKLLFDDINQAVVTTKQPTDWYRKDPRLRAYLDDACHDRFIAEELALFAAADRLRHLQTEILPALAVGKVVISDRYVFSTYAYFWARGISDLDWLKQLNRHAIMPDVTFYLDVPSEVANSRVVKRDGAVTKREELNVLRTDKVRECFLGQLWGQTDNYHVIDATKPSVEVVAAVMEILIPIVNRRFGQEIGLEATVGNGLKLGQKIERHSNLL